MENLPVVDFSSLNISRASPLLEENEVNDTGKKIVKALSEIGFVYLTNHGILDEEVEELKTLANDFFSLPSHIKEKYNLTKPHGYLGPNRERLDNKKPGDLKESFEACPFVAEDHSWPTETVDFKERMIKFYNRCKDLAERIKLAISIGLGIESEDLFVLCPNGVYDSFNNLRILRYPPVQDGVLPGQLRCGAHTDYGAFSILFQDNSGGLQVMNTSGKWIDATPVPGAVLVNIGDLMQLRTSGKLKSTMHRVVIPEEGGRRNNARFSAAFFVHPPYESTITSLDTKDDAPPQHAGKHYEKRFAGAYDGLVY